MAYLYASSTRPRLWSAFAGLRVRPVALVPVPLHTASPPWRIAPRLIVCGLPDLKQLSANRSTRQDIYALNINLSCITKSLVSEIFQISYVYCRLLTVLKFCIKHDRAFCPGIKYYLLTGTYTCLLTYLLTHSRTYSLTHTLTHSLTHSLTSLLNYILTYLLAYLLTCLLTYLLTYLQIQTFLCCCRLPALSTVQQSKLWNTLHMYYVGSVFWSGPILVTLALAAAIVFFTFHFLIFLPVILTCT